MQEEPKEEEPKPRRRGIRWFFCCGAPPGERKTRERKPKRERRERAHRRRHRHRTPGAATPVKAASNNARSDLCQTSILSGGQTAPAGPCAAVAWRNGSRA